MQTVEMRNSVISSVQRALLGEVSRRLRGVAVRWNENSITILCYYDHRIYQKDREAMSCVETEVMADFPELEIRLSVRLYVRGQRKPIDSVWVYLRSENKNIPRWRANYLARRRRKIVAKKPGIT